MVNNSWDLLKTNGTVYHKVRKLNYSFKLIERKIGLNLQQISKLKSTILKFNQILWLWKTQINQTFQ